jgi:hypothetical protein
MALMREVLAGTGDLRRERIIRTGARGDGHLRGTVLQTHLAAEQLQALQHAIHPVA